MTTEMKKKATLNKVAFFVESRGVEPLSKHRDH